MSPVPAHLPEAQKKGVQRRKQLKELRLALKAEEVDYFELVCGSDGPIIEEVVGSARLSTLVPMIRGIGRNRALEVIRAFGVRPEQRLRELTPEQRRNLAYVIKGARSDAYVL